MEHAGASNPSAEYEDWYRNTTLPLYGLPASYAGTRMLGDSQREWVEDQDGRGPRVTQERFGLGHGNPVSGADPWLQVITATASGPTALELLRAEALRPLSDIRPATASTVHVALVVDGKAMGFHGIESGGGWVVQAPLDSHVLTVVGVHWARDDLELIRIDNLEPYISGRRRFIWQAREEA